MKTNGQYQPTVSDIVEAQQQREDILLLAHHHLEYCLSHNNYSLCINVLLHLFLSILQNFYFPVSHKNN
jgi:hypothetical protein